MILIRADANEKIGTGHVMRCLSIAQAFTAQGETVQFVTADHCGDKLIRDRGFETVCLNTEWERLDCEVPALIEAIKDRTANLLLVDSYYVTEYYFKKLSPYIKLAYIDDMNQAVWDVDYLINYNIFAPCFDYSLYDKTRSKLLLNPLYAPLREEFKGLPEHTIKKSVTNVLVSAGGADPEKVSAQLMSTICPNHPEISFHFVIGALNPNINELMLYEDDNIILHINEKRMSDLMMTCDIAISAAGTTLYELCAAGIPTITYSLADNQIAAAMQFEKQGIMLSAGDCRTDDLFVERVNYCLQELLNSINKRKDLSRKMQALVDGKGADRIVESLL